MDIASFLASLEASGIATRIRDSLYIFPLIEATHVFGLAIVIGTIATIDLRLLGVPSTRRSFRQIASDVLKWTWAGFAVTASTGALMFVTNAGVYYHNPFFRAKMLLLLLAGLNMLVFHFITYRGIGSWDDTLRPPPAARAAGAISITLWLGIVAFGRWIGFTIGF